MNLKFMPYRPAMNVIGSMIVEIKVKSS